MNPEGDGDVYNHKQSVKEVVRHVLYRCGLTGLLNTLRRLRGQNTSHIRKQDIAQTFTQIYANKVWMGHADNHEALSGAGSTQAATDTLLVELAAFLKEVECRELLDIGCGDYNWMRHLQGDFNYLGIDIVPAVIDANNAAHADAHHHFLCVDATKNPVPGGDVAICREVLFHLSFADGAKLLQNIKRRDLNMCC